MEVIAILVVALLVFGPSRLPEMGRQIGKAMRELRKFQGSFQDEMRDVFDPKSPPQPGSASRPIDPAWTPAPAPPNASDPTPAPPNAGDPTPAAPNAGDPTPAAPNAGDPTPAAPNAGRVDNGAESPDLSPGETPEDAGTESTPR